MDIWLSKFGIKVNKDKSYNSFSNDQPLVCDFLSRTYCKFGKLAAPPKNVVTSLFFYKPWSNEDDTGINNFMEQIDYFKGRNGNIP